MIESMDILEDIRDLAAKTLNEFTDTLRKHAKSDDIPALVAFMMFEYYLWILHDLFTSAVSMSMEFRKGGENERGRNRHFR